MKSENKKTKILAVGDIHGDTGLVEKLAEKAEKENVDVVILAGDLTFLEESTKNLIGPFVKKGKEVFIIPGNHESNITTDYLATKYSVKNLHGYSFKKNNLGFFGAGGATDIGPYTIDDKEIFELLKKAHKYLEKNKTKKKIMVTHMHSKDSQSEFSGVSGSEAVKKAIEKFQPEILINGHIHEAGGIEEKIGKTKIINVARREKIFEI